MTKLAQMTPVEIDTLLAPIWERQAKVQEQILRYKKVESETYAKIEKIKKGLRVPGVFTPLDGIELVEKLSLIGRYIANEGNKLMALEAEALPYEAEYTRRGGWTRVFLATSSNGHAHKGTECSTCHHGEYRTNFAWLVQYSGLPESEIVADAGERACTTCYPSAPVNVLKQATKMFTPDEVEAAKARELREAERARKAREAADKGILTPEGLPLDISSPNSSYQDIAKTLRTAEIKLTDLIYDLVREQQHEHDPEYAWMYENGRRISAKEQAKIAHEIWWIARAVAAKKGLTFQEVFEIHEKKAQAKIRKVDREWAKQNNR